MTAPHKRHYRCQVCGISADETAIHRTSPKGKGMPFLGRCEAHLDHRPDDAVLAVTDVIEFDNLRYDADHIVIGPECFADANRTVICWKGENYYKTGRS